MMGDVDWTRTGPEGLSFFGRVSASVTHELKNCLAVINENTGLIQDLLAMAERGRPLDPQRLATAAERTKLQIVRANNIIKDLNQFAHTVDESVRAVDLGDMVRLAVALHRRPAAMKETELETALPAEELLLSTSPFLLENLLGLCLQAAVAAVVAPPVSDRRLVRLAVEPSAAGARIVFSGLDAPAALASDILARGAHLASALSACLAPAGDGAAMVLELAPLKSA